ncbi:endonuclease 8-like 3 isoform X2 [Thalassophryne amazonica]|uniref:endonuclease 8-like 3 isoform X2 n=1 Tax=Thalassophryne amazonica TaxID=390379 RepID=UPI001471DDBB|nr:endonuclease 8-like 3 isoform X2 [Thalassophryne amazonica]
MVEGPGCKLNGEKIRRRVQKGQKVKEIRGTLTAANKNSSGKNAFCLFNGGHYTGVETLGKELFMYFGPRALRVHFGMNGSMRINQTGKREKNDSSPALEIHLTNDIVCFFDSTVEIRVTEDCEQRVRALESLDVCSSRFSFSCVEEAVKRQNFRMLCDVLLDQVVMPGVGNIIKNEALFDSGLHPAVKCCKSGSPLYKHYKVYKRPQCGHCSHVITVCRLGDSSRMTYFCERCQRGDPSEVDVRKLPVRNTLFAWTYNSRTNDNVAKPEEKDWICQLCTLINQPAAKSCDACLSPRPHVHKDGISTEASLLTTDLIKYPCTAFQKPQEELKLNWRSAFGTSTLVLSDVSKKPKPVNSTVFPVGTHLNSVAVQQGLYKYSVCQGTTSPNYASGGWQKQSAERSDGESLASYSHPSKKMRIDHGPFLSNNAQSRTPNSSIPKTDAPSWSSSSPPNPTVPRCTSHHRPALLRAVHKEGENKGRRFYVCSLPRETKCNFFEWADLHFPLCHHGKRCLMRTVLKLGPNNGRKFFTCSFRKGKQCDFFQWAEHEPGLFVHSGC